MFNPQQSCNTNPTSLYKSLNPVINPNPNMFFPQPVLPSELPSSGQVLNPPATDPSGPPGSNLSNSGGFDGQPQIHDGPNAGSRSWVAQQADPITHASATNSLNENSIVSIGLCKPGNDVFTNQHLVTNVKKTVPKKTKVKKTVLKKAKVIQSMRCEVCDMDFDSNAYKTHMIGKKHKKKSGMHNNPATTVFNASNVAAGEGLVTKRQKLVEGGTTVVFMRVCTMCNVVCNSQEMYDTHLAGRNHAAQAYNQPQHGMELSVAAFSNYISRTSPMVMPQDHGRGQCESNANKTRADPFVRCDVCNIYCPSNYVIEHKMGKKHLKKLEQLKKTETDTSSCASIHGPVTTVPVPGPMQNADVNQSETEGLKNENATESQAPREDTEKKKPKIMEDGADRIEHCVAINLDSGIIPKVLPQDNKNGACESDPNKTSAYQLVRCDICNIYCTSQRFLIEHKMGKKHLKKLEQLKKMETDTSTRASIHEPVTTVPVPGPMQNPDVNQGETEGLKNENATESQAPREDSEKKKPKIMEDGADRIEHCVAINLDSGIIPEVLPQDNKNGACESDPNKTSAYQLVRCDICNVYCTSQRFLIEHKMGKKHLKNLEKLKKTETDTSTCASIHEQVTTVPVPGPMQNPDVNQGETEGLKNENATESQAPREDSEKKKRNIMEDGEDGIEHSVAINLDSDSGISHEVLPQDNKNGACESDPNKTSAYQLVRCDICNIYCTSQRFLIEHKMGKKHLKNLEKLKKTEKDTSTRASIHGPVMTVPVPGPMQNADVNQSETEGLKNENAIESQAPREDSEKKKRNIMEDGEDGIEHSVAINLDSDSGISPEVLPQDNKNGACESDPNKTSAYQLVRCDICNIYCTSQRFLIEHKVGKKHLKNLEKLKKMETDTSTRASIHGPVTTVPVPGPMQNVDVNQSETEGLKNENAIESQAPREDSEKKKRNIMEDGEDGIEHSVAIILDSGISPEVLPQDNKNGACESYPNKTSAYQLVRCDVCNIYCTRHSFLTEHKMRKKHLRKLEQLKKMETETSPPASRNASVMIIPVNGPMENPEISQDKIDDLKNKNAVDSQTPKDDKKRKIMEVNKNAVESQTPKDDLETKKRKLMEAGAGRDVRVCIICNVVCSSQTVLDTHLAGQRHATMVRKQAAAMSNGSGDSSLVADTKEEG